MNRYALKRMVEGWIAISFISFFNVQRYDDEGND